MQHAPSSAPMVPRGASKQEDGDQPMSDTPARKLRLLSPRRLGLLAGVAGLGVVGLMTASDLATTVKFPMLNTAAYAQTAQRPVGFADIVEQVKPAVISVRVKMDGGPRLMGFDALPRATPGSPMDRFFRRLPESGIPSIPGLPDELRRQPPGRNLVTGQGSGFFLSADGYAVTNNHVVDKAETVEVSTDDG